MALKILGVALKVAEKGVALIVGETAASHLTPLHAHGSTHIRLSTTLTGNRRARSKGSKEKEDPPRSISDRAARP